MNNPAFIQPLAANHHSKEIDYRHFKANPINGALGAELDGVDLSGDINERLFTEIHQALMNHQVIVFRNQNLSPAQLVALGQRFGHLHLNPFVKGLADYPQVIEIKSEENAEKRFTGLWHSDISWGERPSLGSLLYAVNVPEYGGDTLFANMVEAYNGLSKGLQKTLQGLRAEHTANRFHSASAEHADYSPEGVFQPVVRTHPVTGSKALFVNEYFTTRFEDMSQDESEGLLKYLFQHSVRPDYTCRIRWRPGTLVIWDNRCTMHYATNDYQGQSRLMHRVTVEGDIPR